MAKEKIINSLDKCAFFFFGVLVLFLPISNAAIESSFGFIFFFAIIKALLRRPTLGEIKKFFNNKINLSLLVFHICITFSMLATGTLLSKSFETWYSKWGQLMLLFYFGQVFLNQRRVKILLKVFLVSGFLICLDGIFQLISGYDFIRGFPVFNSLNLGFRAITVTFEHYNDFAAYAIVLFFVVFGFFQKPHRRLINTFFILFLILIAANLFFTYSRGAWVSFLFVNLILAICYKFKKKAILPFFFLSFFILVLFIFPLSLTRIFYFFKDGGDADRLRMWKVAFLMFKDSPILGRGLGLFMHYFSEYTNMDIQYAHNCYLQILAETGILGLVSFLWFLKNIILAVYKRLRESLDGIFCGLYLGFLAYLTYAFFDTQLYSLKLSTLFWVLASFLTVYISPSIAGKRISGKDRDLE